jgi:hypothetical protein
MDITTNVRYPEFALNLLGRLNKREITIYDFLFECAYWALREGFDEVRPLQLPNKPTPVDEFELLPIDRIQKLDHKYYDDNPLVVNYYHKLHWVLDKNKTVLNWLKEIRGYIPSGDGLSINKIDKRIEMFNHWKSAVSPSLVKYFEIRDYLLVDTSDKETKKMEEEGRQYWGKDD